RSRYRGPGTFSEPGPASGGRLRRPKLAGARGAPSERSQRKGPDVVKNLVELLLALPLVRIAGDRQLLHDEAAGRVQHAALAERQGLHPLETIEIAEHLRDLEQRPRLDLLHEAAIPAVPGLAVD